FPIPIRFIPAHPDTFSCPHGNDPKQRPALVLSSGEKILEGGEIVVAAISTAFSRPIPSHWFELPSHPSGDPRTGLDQPCVVKSDWLKKSSTPK
ncbi:MAG TPA: hypothetical protein PK867_23415, partial [Pirellulales bacterium]|nr:hypothetical protein [Pirellulales bacterium]